MDTNRKTINIAIQIYYTFISEVLKRIWPADAQQGETNLQRKKDYIR